MGGSYYPQPYQGDRLLELMQQRGQIGQQAAQQSGEIWGNALQSLGQQAGQFVQQLGQQRDEKRVQGAVSAGMANPDAFESTLSKLDPQQQAKARKAFADANEAASKLDERKSLIAQHQATLAKAQQDYKQDTADYAGTVALRTLPFVNESPDGGLGAIGIAIQHAKSRKVPGADQYDEPYAQAQAMLKQAQESGDPMAIPAVGEKIRQQFKPMLEQMTLGMSPEARKKLTEEQDPKLVPLPENGLVDPRTRQVVVPGPGKTVNYQHIETSKGIQLLNPVTGELGPVIAKGKPAASAGLVAGRTDLTDSSLDMAALDYLKSRKIPAGMSRDPNAIKRIVNRAASLTSEDVGRLEAGGLNIASNVAGLAADTGSLKGLQKQADAVSAFENTAKKNAAVLKQTMKDLPDAGAKFLNSPIRSLAGQLGSEKMAAFNVARQSVQNEYARIISNPTLSGTMSDSARKEGEALLSPDLTVGQLLSAMDILGQEAANRHSSYQEQLGTIRGRMGGGGQGAPAPAGGRAAPVRVSSPADAARLPKGTPIILPDGRIGEVP